MIRSGFGGDFDRDLEYIRIYQMGFSNQKEKKGFKKMADNKPEEGEKVSFSKMLDEEMLVLERRFV